MKSVQFWLVENVQISIDANKPAGRCTRGAIRRNRNSATSRNSRSTVSLSSCCPNPASVGTTPVNRSGHSPLTVTSSTATHCTRRSSQRSALARLPCGGGRARSTATARLAASSVTRTASSNSSNVSLTWAAKQSGKRLTVRLTRRQRNRRISAPRGFTRR